MQAGPWTSVRVAWQKESLQGINNVPGLVSRALPGCPF